MSCLSQEAVLRRGGAAVPAFNYATLTPFCIGAAREKIQLAPNQRGPFCVRAVPKHFSPRLSPRPRPPAPVSPPLDEIADRAQVQGDSESSAGCPRTAICWLSKATQRSKATRADQRGYSVRVGGREGERLFFDRNISRGTQDVTDRVLCTANTRACACSRVCTQGVSGPCAEIFSRNRPSCTALTRVLTRTAALLSQ